MNTMNRKFPVILATLLLLCGISGVHATDSDEFNAQAEQHKDDSDYHMVKPDDSKSEFSSSGATADTTQAIEADSQSSSGAKDASPPPASSQDSSNNGSSSKQ